jgi:hypothetical protein
MELLIHIFVRREHESVVAGLVKSATTFFETQKASVTIIEDVAYVRTRRRKEDDALHLVRCSCATDTDSAAVDIEALEEVLASTLKAAVKKDGEALVLVRRSP